MAATPRTTSRKIETGARDGRQRALAVDDPLDGAPADGTEADVVAREHDAVRRRPVEPLRLVGRSLEGAHLSRVLHPGEEPRLGGLLLPEELVERLRRRAFGHQLLSFGLKRLALLSRSSAFDHGVGRGVPGADEACPLQPARVLQRRDVRLPRLGRARPPPSRTRRRTCSTRRRGRRSGGRTRGRRCTRPTPSPRRPSPGLAKIPPPP